MDAQPDIVIRLRAWARHRVGNAVKMPNDGNWGDLLNADLEEAIAEIERLRSLAGAVTRGDGELANIKSRIAADKST